MKYASDPNHKLRILANSASDLRVSACISITAIDNLLGDMKGAKAVQKSVVKRSWIHQVSQTQLFDVNQTKNLTLVDEFVFE